MFQHVLTGILCLSQADDLKAKGNAALTAGNFQEAIDFYTQGLALDSSSHVLYSNRSAAYAKVARYAEALADGEKAVSLKPEWPKVKLQKYL